MPATHPRVSRSLYVVAAIVLIALAVRVLFPGAFTEYTRGTLESLRRWSAESSSR